MNGSDSNCVALVRHVARYASLHYYDYDYDYDYDDDYDDDDYYYY